MGDSDPPLWGRVAEHAASLIPESPYRPQEGKPRLLIVGAGMMGREHLRVTQQLGWAEVQGIVDPFDGSIEWAQSDWALLSSQPLTVYADLREACLDSAVDAIVICSPNHTHYDVLKIVCESGKPILLEKPMEIGRASCRERV